MAPLSPNSCVPPPAPLLAGGHERDHEVSYPPNKKIKNESKKKLHLPVSSQPSARSSGTAPSTSPSPFQGRGGREGGVVAATSRDTITQHI